MTTTGFAQNIKHVFVLMLENRSFDHMLGFSGITGTSRSRGQYGIIDSRQRNVTGDVDINCHWSAMGVARVSRNGGGIHY